ncbi:Hypothetical predicted protein [Xyrichtys novacula]|uniref:Uncharacterized protein n=1 Tax=Xyrichtys novacula TaxID=13765 RepID=A0AAV1EMJ0_XYRNO|nr:Hypothetical predicted protein [Xyrichtys novacula]
MEEEMKPSPLSEVHSSDRSNRNREAVSSASGSTRDVFTDGEIPGRHAETPPEEPSEGENKATSILSFLRHNRERSQGQRGNRSRVQVCRHEYDRVPLLNLKK